ncbi:type 4b pilus protein PilO2 [Pandoraea sp. PE-S2T-3]|uniref:type 4b pilus protein PilO2 n=1 Tax=Pandoraea sp. PE-S2T-3 TaxID=1986993 RepID=UPI000B3FA646|nr:type 4b pilus protein PilO2 [Pandoraea sp. PE-S2T-3]
MTRALSNHLVVGAQWETLIGLQKEPTEIRGLARSRDASHFAVADDGSGTRTVGLMSLPVASKDEAVPDRYALAAVLGQMVDGANVAFVHADPDDPSAALFVTLRDRRPDIDTVLPLAHLKARLAGWTAEVEGPVKIAGMELADLPPPDVSLSLDAIAEHVRRERPAEARLQLVRKPLPARELAIAAVALLIVAGLGGAGWLGWSWYDDLQQQQRAAANRVDPVDAYKRSLARAIAAEPFAFGADYAQRVQSVVQALPASAGGWRPASIECNAARCSIDWRRKEGGTFDLLLSQRPDAMIVDLDHAKEVVAITDDGQDADAAADARVTPIPRNQFLRTAGARLQALGDYGMDISLTMAEPLVKPPPTAAAGKDVPPSIAKGEWQMAGHLAFLDSVAGLMMRAGNMSLRDVKIDISDGKPVFTAQGTYYVH